MSYILLVIFVFLNRFEKAESEELGCPKNLTSFEKILGAVPPSEIKTILLHEGSPGEPITLECTTKCRKNNLCSGFILYYETPACYYYEGFVDNDGEMTNEIDDNVAWFSKICLQGLPINKSCRKAWAFDRISGAILIGNNTKTLPNKVTRETCLKSCLQERSFQCRSMKFRVSEKKNKNVSLGVCILSSANRHIMPFSYRASNFRDEYIENNCIKDHEKTFCSYEEYENSVNNHVDAKFSNKTKEECQHLCDNALPFTCRGYSLIPTPGEKSSINIQNSKFNCLIHSEDVKIYGPSSLKFVENASYFERATCLNITVMCSEKLMTVTFYPEMDFKGKIYLQGFSENPECFAKGNRNYPVTLKIPLIPHTCGLTDARSIGSMNKTLLSANMVLQYNSLIQAQGDRLVKVGCIFTNSTKIVLGTSFNLTDSNNKGTVIINSTASPIQPNVDIEVVDYLTQEEITDVQIGQELQLKITVSPVDDSFDIMAGNLIAMTEDGADSILLLDDRGCPTNLHIFPALQKLENETTKLLFANFYAFKFTSSPIVRFSIMLEFCQRKCPEVNCDNSLITRNKRYLSVLETVNGTSVKNINRDDFYDVNKTTIKMPLDFVIVVRNKKPLKPDKLLYGENKILIASYDIINNEVCFDYSLLIGLLILWIIIQIILVTCTFLIIKKYKKHYEEEYVKSSIAEIQRNFRFSDNNSLDSRRVRWADRENDSDYL